MPTSRRSRTRIAILAAASAGMLVGASLATMQVASANAVAARPDCPARERFKPGENNYIVGNPDIVQVINGVASWSEYRNPGGANPHPGFLLAVQSASFCRYNYEIWGNSSLGSAFYQSSGFFRTARPFG